MMAPYLQYILTIMGLVAIISYGYGQIRKGRNDSKLDTIKLFKEQVEALEDKVNRQDDEIKKLTKEVHDLHVAIDEKDAKLTETLAILQGRDPQMQAFMVKLNEYTELGKPAIKAIVTDVLPLVKRLEKFLDKQSF